MSDPTSSLGPVVLTGGSLSLADLARVARDPRVRVEVSADALDRVRVCRDQIEHLARRYREDFARLQQGEKATPVLEYGVTTGFGEFKNIPVAPEQLEQLQRNILLSHAVGVGETADDRRPGNYFDADVVRATLVIRLNAFLKGHSGVRPVLVEVVRAMINRGIVPRVPIRGSLGSSGDLGPLVLRPADRAGRHHRPAPAVRLRGGEHLRAGAAPGRGARDGARRHRAPRLDELAPDEEARAGAAGGPPLRRGA